MHFLLRSSFVTYLAINSTQYNGNKAIEFKLCSLSSESPLNRFSQLLCLYCLPLQKYSSQSFPNTSNFLLHLSMFAISLHSSSPIALFSIQVMWSLALFLSLLFSFVYLFTGYKNRKEEERPKREVAHVPSFIIAKSTFSQFRLVMIKAHIAIEYQWMEYLLPFLQMQMQWQTRL